jgi:3-hydroxyisobutyrate dehydrogenase-like beta-hydroxyacid dehydrogenase
MKTTVLGLGNMGHALASRVLARGHHVTVWNRSPGKAGDLVEQGAVEARSVEEAVTDADAVLTSLSGDDAVRDVLLPHGYPRPQITGTLVDFSTVSPGTSSALAEQYGDRYVACPLAGAPALMRAGHALLIVAGPRAATGVVDRLLADISDTRYDAGTQVELAAQAKLLNNFLLLGGAALLADAVAAGQRAGIPDDNLADLLGHLPVVPAALTQRIPGFVGRDHPAQFSVDLGRKDLGLFADAFPAGSADGLRSAVKAAFDLASQQGLGQDDITAVVEPLR